MVAISSSHLPLRVSFNCVLWGLPTAFLPHRVAQEIVSRSFFCRIERSQDVSVLKFNIKLNKKVIHKSKEVVRFQRKFCEVKKWVTKKPEIGYHHQQPQRIWINSLDYDIKPLELPTHHLQCQCRSNASEPQEPPPPAIFALLNPFRESVSYEGSNHSKRQREKQLFCHWMNRNRPLDDPH